MILNRRMFIGSGLATSALLYAPAVLGQAKPKVVVIGGGAGGATAARYLGLYGGGRDRRGHCQARAGGD